jgi:hypothetical protein
MDVPDSHAFQFAKTIVDRLVEKGHTAYFAGGCVRDFVMRTTPTDFDVATTAKPNEVREIFGYRRTLEVGAAFGVICVVEKWNEKYHQVEVATFRSDGTYLDGRHPDSVEFTTPAGDAERRDFTINGLFFDPLGFQIIDFVGGLDDIENRIIRAIGEARLRFNEDKLRLLRAVRFAARLGFELEPTTSVAIREMADQIHVVSPERIAAEIRKMFAHVSCCDSLRLLNELNLLAFIFPELTHLFLPEEAQRPFIRRLELLDRFSFESVLGILCASIIDHETSGSVRGLNWEGRSWNALTKELLSILQRRWRLSNDEVKSVEFALLNLGLLMRSSSARWSELQPILVSPHIGLAMQTAEAILGEMFGHSRELDRCRNALEGSIDALNPPALIDGRVLNELKVPTGPVYARMIKSARAAQLDRLVSTRDEAVTWLKQRFAKDFPG